MSLTLIDIGTEYEIYTKNIIAHKYINCWLWKDIPYDIYKLLLPHKFTYNESENITNNLNISYDDIGCDIVGQNSDNTFDFIQCKNYSTLGIDNIISICDLSGFYNFIAENDIKNAIVYYSGKLSAQIICRKNKIKYLNLPYNKNTYANIIPRFYQIDAYNKLKDEQRSILNMPCGTGKTLVSYYISKDYDNIILLSPLIATTEQLMIHYKNYYVDNSINFITIHCQTSRKLNDIKLLNKNIIGATFDSCDIINKLFDKLNGSVMVIIDEFHNISNNMISNNNCEIYKLLNSNNKILFISATPKYYKYRY